MEGYINNEKGHQVTFCKNLMCTEGLKDEYDLNRGRR